MAQEYQTFRKSDAELLNAFNKISNSLKIQNPSVHLRIDSSYPQALEGPIEEILKNKELKPILDRNISIFGIAKLSIPAPFSSSVTVTRKGTSDTVKIDIHPHLSLPQASNIVAIINEFLNPYERDESFDKLLGDELAEFYRKREQGLLRLESLSQRLISDNEKYRQKFDEKQIESEKELKTKHNIDQENLEKDYQNKNLKLTDREKELEVHLKEIDDRSSRHARRQLRQDLKAAINQRGKEFILTKKTNTKRILIHILFACLIGMLGYILITFVIDWKDKGGDWILYFKLPISIISIAAAFIYYIRWQDNWFRRHADEEFNIKRMELDIDRASWVVEMALEWKEEKGTEIPSELLDRLTANLFDKTSTAKPVQHPSEDLLSALLSASQELNLTIPGFGSAKLNRKGAKQLEKAINENK